MSAAWQSATATTAPAAKRRARGVAGIRPGTTDDEIQVRSPQNGHEHSPARTWRLQEGQGAKVGAIAELYFGGQLAPLGSSQVQRRHVAVGASPVSGPQ